MRQSLLSSCQRPAGLPSGMGWPPVVNMPRLLPSPPGSLLTISAGDSGQLGRGAGARQGDTASVLTARCLVCGMRNASAGSILNHPGMESFP